MPDVDITAKPQAPFAVSKYRFEDREHLITVINVVCAEARWMHTPLFHPTPMWTHALSDENCPDHLLLVPRAKGRLIGWCRVFPTSASDEAELGIGLLAKYRDRGLGTFLVQEAVMWTRKRGFLRLVLATRLDNRRAIHVFNKCGFTKLKSCDNMRMVMLHDL